MGVSGVSACRGHSHSGVHSTEYRVLSSVRQPWRTTALHMDSVGSVL